MHDHDEAVTALLAELTSPEAARRMQNGDKSNGFGEALGRLAFDFVFGQLWLRPGLDRRSRSLVTLGVLITLRATGQLRFHIPAALRNGLTREEIEEVIYHCSAYAGFPAASEARDAAEQIMAEIRT